MTTYQNQTVTFATAAESARAVRNCFFGKLGALNVSAISRDAETVVFSVPAETVEQFQALLGEYHTV
jgi:hypothetical protein